MTLIVAKNTLHQADSNNPLYPDNTHIARQAELITWARPRQAILTALPTTLP